MQQSTEAHISEQEAKEQLEKQVGIAFTYSDAKYNKGLKQWSFFIQNQQGKTVFRAAAVEDFGPYLILANHLQQPFAEIINQYVWIYGDECTFGSDSPNPCYCLTNRGWLAVADIESKFLAQFGKYRKNYSLQNEQWTVIIDKNECSSSTYRKNQKPGFPPLAEKVSLSFKDLDDDLFYQLPPEPTPETASKQQSTDDTNREPADPPPADTNQTADEQPSPTPAQESVEYADPSAAPIANTPSTPSDISDEPATPLKEKPEEVSASEAANGGVIPGSAPEETKNDADGAYEQPDSEAYEERAEAEQEYESEEEDDDVDDTTEYDENDGESDEESDTESSTDDEEYNNSGEYQDNEYEEAENTTVPTAEQQSGNFENTAQYKAEQYKKNDRARPAEPVHAEEAQNRQDRVYNAVPNKAAKKDHSLTLFVIMICAAIITPFLHKPIPRFIRDLMTPSYTVRFDPNTATSGTPPSTFKAKAQTEVLIPETRDLSKAGYIFSGWNTAVDGSGTDYEPGSSYTFAEDTTLYAQWGVEKFVHMNELNVRASPSAQAKSLASLKQNKKVLAIPNSASQAWVKIKYNRKTGYVNSTYLRDFFISEVLIGNAASGGVWLTRPSSKPDLRARSMRFLRTQVRIVTVADSVKADFKIKIIDPYGDREYSQSSPAGYTYTQSTPINDSGVYELAGWGNANAGYYYTGKWRVEIWYANPKNPSNTNAMIASCSFYLQ